MDVSYMEIVPTDQSYAARSSTRREHEPASATRGTDDALDRPVKPIFFTIGPSGRKPPQERGSCSGVERHHFQAHHGDPSITSFWASAVRSAVFTRCTTGRRRTARREEAEPFADTRSL